MNKPKIYTVLGLIAGTLILSLTYSDVLIEKSQTSLESFLMINFVGYLFFIIMPIEALFLYYLTESYNPITLILGATITGFFGQMVDFMLGKLIDEKHAITIVGKEKYGKIKHILHKYGKPIIFVFSLSILSSPLVTFISGIVKCDWKMIFFYGFLGLLVKYIIITGVYMLF